MDDPPFDPQSDTGNILTCLDQALEESRKLRENLKTGQPVTSEDPPEPPAQNPSA